MSFTFGNNQNMNAYTVEDSDRDGYREFLQSVKVNFSHKLNGGYKLFTTAAIELFDTFLVYLPAEARLHYTCNACRHFVNRFGGLVTIDEKGLPHSAMWNEELVPDFFKPAVRQMRINVEMSSVSGVFIAGETTLGYPMAGGWSHLAVEVPYSELYRDRYGLKTAGQMAAEKREDFIMLQNALAKYGQSTIETAYELLKSDSLYRGEKTVGMCKWLLNVKRDVNSTNIARRKENKMWKAVSTAPTGFTHVSSSMIGTLLDDINEGMDFATVKRRFDDKMDPMKYQRPQAPPKAGNIARGEEIIKAMGAERSLERRFARLDEIKTIWKSRTKQAPVAGGVFGHLTARHDSSKANKTNMSEVGMKKVTWEKFKATILPFAENIEYKVQGGSDNYSGILTAVHDDAPPIIQWDSEEARNPFSHYVYNGGSPASRWGLTMGWTKVNAVTYQPSAWQEGFEHQGNAVYFILDGAKDINFASRYTGGSNCLFPEILKSELREIRSTIEAFSASKTIEGYEDASACGIRLQKGHDWNAVLRVTTATNVQLYKIDRWD